MAPPVQEGHQRFDGRNQGRIQGVLIRPSNRVGPGFALELPGHPNELEAILRRERGSGNPGYMQRDRQQDDRDQPSAFGHRDPPDRRP
jgi:hypothetical protein